MAKAKRSPSSGSKHATTVESCKEPGQTWFHIGIVSARTYGQHDNIQQPKQTRRKLCDHHYRHKLVSKSSSPTLRDSMLMLVRKSNSCKRIERDEVCCDHTHTQTHTPEVRGRKTYNYSRGRFRLKYLAYLSREKDRWSLGCCWSELAVSLCSFRSYFVLSCSMQAQLFCCVVSFDWNMNTLMQPRTLPQLYRKKK